MSVRVFCGCVNRQRNNRSEERVFNVLMAEKRRGHSPKHFFKLLVGRALAMLNVHLQWVCLRSRTDPATRDQSDEETNSVIKLRSTRFCLFSSQTDLVWLRD